MTAAAMLRRIARLDAAELAWRLGTGARTLINRAQAAASAPQWDRAALRHVLVSDRRLAAVHDALAASRWDEAHAALAVHFSAADRFVIAPGLRASLVNRIVAEFPAAATDAARRADAVLAGDYDLLGYKALRFGNGRDIEWHYDPVHDGQSPRRFWSTVPYLDRSCGDHKIIWELNRHQHWLKLGRAYWLSGDERYRSGAVNELASWIAANPPLIGINWASMLELALRSISWTWAIHFFADSTSRSDERPWLVDLLVALDRQLQHVEQNLSYYFSPNTHLLGEALALYVTGRTLPLLGSSRRREEIGRRVLIQQISRQITSDGGHCERSAHYQRYSLDFYLLALTIARITRDPAAAQFEPAVASLATAARLLADDRGMMPLLGDDDGGMALPITGRPVDDIRDSLSAAATLLGRPDLRVGGPAEEVFWLLGHPRLANSLESLAAMPPPSPIASGALPSTGYYISRSVAGDHMVLDGGPHGYMNGGHAHADALSLTLTVRGVPLLIDTGTATYTAAPQLRDRFRSTALHNTLVLDQRCQSIPSGPFHWSHTAQAVVQRWRTNAGFDYFEAAHDGYRPAEHRRHVLILPGDLVVVADYVTGRPDGADGIDGVIDADGADSLHRADVHWHVDPRWRVAVSDRRAILTGPGERVVLVAPHGVIDRFYGDAGSGLGWHAPVYGRIEPATTIRTSLTSSLPFWVISVFGLTAANDVMDAETVPVWAEAGVLKRSIGLRIARSASTDCLLIAEPVEDATASWRLADTETNARMLFHRTDAEGAMTRLAIVDGSFVRRSGRQPVRVALMREAAEMHLDLGRSGQGARMSGPAFGATIQVGERELPLDVERRAAARFQAPGTQGA